MNDDRPEELEEFLRGSLNRLPDGDGSLGPNVIAAIRGRTPVQMGVIAQLPKANAVAALLLITLMTLSWFLGPDRGPVAGEMDDPETPTILAYEEEAGEYSSSAVVLTALFIEGMTR